jgi:hypothetical protein
MFLLAFIVGRLPVSEEWRQSLLSVILWPLLVIGRSLQALVDRLGPQGLSEPASMYLPPWGVWCLILTSGLLLVATLFAGALAVLTWQERRHPEMSARL